MYVFAVLEEKKAGVQKEAADLRASLREVEKARLEARRELQELRRQLKLMDGERNKLGQEVAELQVRIQRDEEKEEESRRENFVLKQKVGYKVYCSWLQESKMTVNVLTLEQIL